MSSDGHTGVAIKNIGNSNSHHFRLILALVEYSGGGGSVCIHASSGKVYMSGPTTEDFLMSLGFRPFDGCQFFGNRCFFREIAIIPSAYPRPEVRREFEAIHMAFNQFANNIEALFENRKSIGEILDRVGRGIQFQNQPIFNAPVSIVFDPSEAPGWINDIKLAKLVELESQRAEIEKEIQDLSAFLPLVYASGGLFEEPVVNALRFLGLDADRTEKGFTVDILANTKDGEKRFGFEVTGIRGPIAKKSNKLTQVVEFERIKENDEKTVLLANTFCEEPISERQDKEDFTKDAVEFLSAFPVIMMTGWDLYRMVQNVMEGRDKAADLVNMMHGGVGVLEYT